MKPWETPGVLCFPMIVNKKRTQRFYAEFLQENVFYLEASGFSTI
jgi:hypothetical protein